MGTQRLKSSLIYNQDVLSKYLKVILLRSLKEPFIILSFKPNNGAFFQNLVNALWCVWKEGAHLAMLIVESQGFSKQTFVFFGYFPKYVTDF